MSILANTHQFNFFLIVKTNNFSWLHTQNSSCG